ncbi:MAG TPA: NAD(P)(+) transhydrogenase (Re/Si-specific) subunit beta, partial [Candidatus Limnocylindria bacterium]|nr:NAD(P)(+) transhydrogenase (Re/Si-specific) subunit beta [Candidatus Limnocylindria bacterium]
MSTLEILTFLVWLVASVTFIFALKFLASPKTARTGNLLGAAGMALIVLWTFFTHDATSPEADPGMFGNWWI